MTQPPIGYGMPSNIIATHINHDAYMQHYAHEFCEWVQGDVIKMSPIHIIHDNLSNLLRDLLKIYLKKTGLGRVIGAPFVMKMALSSREPDLQIILGDNLDNLQDTYMDGAADICIDQLNEYEQAGVQEYWLFDPRHRGVTFYRLNDEAVYIAQPIDGDVYTTPLLPKFTLHIPTLWRMEQPDVEDILETVKRMLE